MIVENIISLLKLIVLFTGIKGFYLGVIIIGIGNSIPDMFANLSIARLGLHKMAITGCISGPIFNILVGLGLSFAFFLLQG